MAYKNNFERKEDIMDILALKKTANEVRKGIVTAVHSAKSGHPGGSLSAADLLTYLYFEEMNIDPKDPKKADRDRFVLSKGHIAPGLYSTLAQRGFFPVEDLKTLRHVGSYLQGHPDMKHIPGVDMSSGSLGQGISAAVGMALSAKLDDASYRVYTLLGDGEIQEGQVWEASMFAGARKLDNLCVIVDNNGLQIDGKIEDVCSPYPITDKFKAFNFNVIEIDAHDFEQIADAFKKVFLPEEIQLIMDDKGNGKYQLDLWKVNELILTQAGIRKENLDITDICTCCNSDKLFSHRASHGKRGNMGCFMCL